MSIGPVAIVPALHPSCYESRHPGHTVLKAASATPDLEFPSATHGLGFMLHRPSTEQNSSQTPSQSSQYTLSVYKHTAKYYLQLRISPLAPRGQTPAAEQQPPFFNPHRHSPAASLQLSSSCSLWGHASSNLAYSSTSVLLHLQPVL